MSGLYFHIPFCKTRCNYCDFYKSTNLSYIPSIVQALKEEMKFRKDFIDDKNIKTIYFGGGTPSLLSISEIELLIKEVSLIFQVYPHSEITLEANPDDLSPEYLYMLKKIGINRLSIGIQSFSDTDLKLMGRRHNSFQSINAIKDAQKAGFDNISIDLIYGIPGMTIQQWQENLHTVFDLDIQHLSAYHLTYHEGTLFYDKLQKGIIQEIEEEESILQFEELIQCAEKNHFVHYEISNFACKGFYSQHNSSYWNQTEYLGLGPSAHSYNHNIRYWNVSDINQYLESVKQGKNSGEGEKLTLNDKFNDYIITGLRRNQGIDIQYIKMEFGNKYFNEVERVTEKNILKGNVIREKDRIRIVTAGLFISDQIISDYLYLEKSQK